jgi:hypothetical protein
MESGHSDDNYQEYKLNESVISEEDNLFLASDVVVNEFDRYFEDTEDVREVGEHGDNAVMYSENDYEECSDFSDDESEWDDTRFTMYASKYYTGN